jgi:betaine-aldehyde dehydrogenase
VESQRGAWLPVYDPSTEEIIAEVPDAGQPTSTVPSSRRGRLRIRRLAADHRSGSRPPALQTGRAHPRPRSALAELESRNCGKPIVEAEYDVADTATCFEYYGGMATKVLGHVNPVPDNALSLSLREPVGVAGQIIPWNYPLLMAAWKLAPALAAGCTCVLKPAEQTPLTALEIAGWFDESVSRRASSTSSPASARRPARRWWPIPASTRSPSPAAPPSAS